MPLLRCLAQVQQQLAGGLDILPPRQGKACQRGSVHHPAGGRGGRREKAGGGRGRGAQRRDLPVLEFNTFPVPHVPIAFTPLLPAPQRVHPQQPTCGRPPG